MMMSSTGGVRQYFKTLCLVICLVIILNVLVVLISSKITCSNYERASSSTSGAKYSINSSVQDYMIPSDNYSFQYILNNPSRCKTNSALKVVMTVVSSANNLGARLDIRNTWGSASLRRDIGIVFMIGATNDSSLQGKIVEENNLYGDIVQENYLDTYRNLTLKSISLLRWVNIFCKNAEFLLKVDDDSFVHLPNLLRFLDTRNVTNNVIYGRMWHGMPPIRDKNSKFYVSFEDFAGDSFSEYMSGPSYIISMDSVPNLLHSALTLKFFPMEDVFITGFCADHANISRINYPEFIIDDKLNTSDTFQNLITAHGTRTSSSVYLAWSYKLELRETNIKSLLQLNYLALLGHLDSLSISEGNPVTELPFWKPYLLFRLSHFPLKFLNEVEVTAADVRQANLLFDDLSGVEEGNNRFMSRKGSLLDENLENLRVTCDEEEDGPNCIVQLHVDGSRVVPLLSLKSQKIEPVITDLSNKFVNECFEEAMVTCTKMTILREAWPQLFREMVIEGLVYLTQPDNVKKMLADVASEILNQQ